MSIQPLSKQTSPAAELAVPICAALEQCGLHRQQAIDHAIEAGLLLIKAKEQIPHGQWLSFLVDNVGIPKRTAQAFMQIARRRDELVAQDLAPLGVEKALRQLAEPKEKPESADARKHVEPVEPAEPVAGPVEPPEAAEPAEPSEPWAEHNEGMARIVDTLGGVNGELRRALDIRGGEVRSKWGKRLSYSGTVRQINAFIRMLEGDGMIVGEDGEDIVTVNDRKKARGWAEMNGGE